VGLCWGVSSRKGDCCFFWGVWRGDSVEMQQDGTERRSSSFSTTRVLLAGAGTTTAPLGWRERREGSKGEVGPRASRSTIWSSVKEERERERERGRGGERERESARETGTRKKDLVCRAHGFNVSQSVRLVCLSVCMLCVYLAGRHARQVVRTIPTTSYKHILGSVRPGLQGPSVSPCHRTRLKSDSLICM